jgi:phosphoglucosamine mutase
MALFGTSGIRGIVSREFISRAFEVGLAVGSSYPGLILGSDTRTSSEALKFTFISALLSQGCRVYDAGIAPTPTIAYAARNFPAAAIITASHNPPEYNGLKLLNPDGSPFDAAQRTDIEERVFSRALAVSPWDMMERCHPYPQAVEEHIERILKDFPTGLNLRVVVDCGCGAASVITPHLFQALGCDVIAINSHPSGYFPRGLEPIAENLSTLMQMVKSSGADLGIAHDGDGDRMMAVDERGRFIPGDKLLLLLARRLKVKRLITTLDASMVAEESEFEVMRTKVGDPFVSEELRNGGEFGGEPSGCWVFPRVSLCPDGIYAAAQIARISAEHRLSQLVDEIPSYHILRGSIAGDNSSLSNFRERLEALAPLSIDTVDGIRLSFNDGWLLIRSSGTEPKIRITAEAKTRERAEELYDLGAKALAE